MSILLEGLDFTELVEDEKPGGVVQSGDSSEIVIHITRVKRSFYRIVPKDGGQTKTLITMNDETLLKLPASEGDIPGIVALVAKQAAIRRKSARDSARRRALKSAEIKGEQ